MEYTLYICEKPSQGRDIAAVLGAKKREPSHITGPGVIVTWCFGHLLEQAPVSKYREDIQPWAIEKLPVVPKDWKMLVKDKSKDQLKAIKKLLEGTSSVVIATDADREGELIAREILHKFKYKGKVARLWLSALDDASIRKALDNIKDGSTTESLYYAGLARQRADWLIGMNASMASTVLFSNRLIGSLSVGRVQTPTLGLIVNRDREIENFKPKDFFELFAIFNSLDQQSIKLKWRVPENIHGDDAPRCLDKTLAQDVADKIQNKNGTITEFLTKNKSQPAPLPFSLSELQKKASSMFNLSAKEVLNIAQALYETHKAITYPRTDCGYLPDEQFGDAENIIMTITSINNEYKEISKLCDFNFKSSCWNNKKVTAHHGMIPTNNKVNLNAMSENERSIYNLICKTFIAQFLGDYKYAQTTVSLTCEGEEFTTSGKQELEAGWKKAIKDNDKTEDNQLPTFDEKTSLINMSSEVVAKKTTPPQRYTEGTLIGAMKSIGRLVKDEKMKKTLRDTSGIGTEATRADILEKILDRDYITKKGKDLISTEKGRALIDTVPELLKNPETTASWEDALNDIAIGKYPIDVFMSQQEEIINEVISNLVLKSKQSNPFIKLIDCKNMHKCPNCSKPLQKIQAKKDKRFFWGCLGYPECKYTAPDLKGSPGQHKERVVQPNATNFECAKCNNELILRKGQHGLFWGCSNYPKCKESYKNHGEKPVFDKVV